MKLTRRHARLTGCVAAALSAAALLTGCGTARPSATPETMGTAETSELFLSAGDEIEVKFFYNPGLNEVQRIRPDGKITLQLIGEVTAAGKTPEELKYVIQRLGELFVEQPEVTVFVRSLHNRKAFVGGNVLQPGVVDMPGRLTALDAILQAGGFNLRSANTKNVIVIRHKGDKRYGCALDLSTALAGADTKPFYLEPNDIVYVPNTRIVQVNQWIDQHVNKIIPQFGISYSDTVGQDGTVTIDTARDFTPVF